MALAATPAGHGILYPKNAGPAPFTLRPSLAVQLLRDQCASLCAGGSTRTSSARFPSVVFTSAGGSASTTNVVKFRATTVPARSCSCTASTATAASFGIVTGKDGSASDIHGWYFTILCPVLHVLCSP